MNRRNFLAMATIGAVSSGLTGSAFAAPAKAIAFDGFVIWDPRPIGLLAEGLFPGKGEALMNAWRLRQFEYCWLRNSMDQYADFWTVTGEALRFAGESVKLAITAQAHDQLMQSFLNMKAHPDVLPALTALKAKGIRLGLCSNLTQMMMQENIKSSGLEGMFEQLLSTDLVKAYKPDRRAYQMAVDGFGLPKSDIIFAAFGGWDAAGAKSFGYRTYWANRGGTPVERLGVTPDFISSDAADLLAFATA